MRSLYPAFAGLRFRRSPERTFVSPADAFVVSAQHNPLLRTDGFRYSLPILRNMENKIQPINQILKL